MLLRIYLPVIFFGIKIVFSSEIMESSDNENEKVTRFTVVSTSPAGSKSGPSGSDIQVHGEANIQQRQERMEVEMRKGKGSKKSGKGGNNVSEDLCRKFLYLLPLLTILPILLLIWKTPRHESYHSYTPYGHHHQHGHQHHKDPHQNYYKKLDENSFDYYRQPLQEQGLPA